MINTGYNAIKLFKIPYNLQQNYKFEKINTKLAYKKFKAYNKVKVGSINSYIVNLFTGSNFFPYFDQFKNERLQANEDALIYDEPMNRQGRDNWPIRLRNFDPLFLIISIQNFTM